MICIPKDKNFPADAAQCDECGGLGEAWTREQAEQAAKSGELREQSCRACSGRGWVSASSSRARRCAYEKCSKPIAPDCFAVYCSNECALADA
jgi:hypothetical protein